MRMHGGMYDGKKSKRVLCCFYQQNAFHVLSSERNCYFVLRRLASGSSIPNCQPLRRHFLHPNYILLCTANGRTHPFSAITNIIFHNIIAWTSVPLELRAPPHQQLFGGCPTLVKRRLLEKELSVYQQTHSMC